MSNYHNLKAWQHARRLAVEAARAARQLPKHEQAVLGTQLREAAYSVAAKIAALTASETVSSPRGEYSVVWLKNLPEP